MAQKSDGALLVLLSITLGIYALGIAPEIIRYILIVLSILGTLPVLWSALRSIREKKISVDLLASVALVASLLTREWSSAAFINLMLTSARIFDRYTEMRARAAIQSLLKLRPEKVKVRRNGQITTLPIAQVVIGDEIILESGDRVPVDGLVLQGSASIDQSSLTGESIPVERTEQQEIYSSTLVVSGSLIMRATKIGSDTTLEKIIRMVESAQNEKAEIRTIGARFASWYIALTLIGALLIYLFSHDLSFVLALLLVVCADDIAVAIPMAYLAAIGYAARRGVIIKGGGYLEALTHIDTLILDKTGTLTSGILGIERVVPQKQSEETMLIRSAMIAEAVSKHPVARAIVTYGESKGIIPDEPEAFEELPGKGMKATWNGKQIIAGKKRFLEAEGITLDAEARKTLAETEAQGLSATLVAYNGIYIGHLGAGDKVRPQAKLALDRMKALGVKRIIMLTGDNEQVARSIAQKTGILEYHAGLLPEDKLRYVQQAIKDKWKIGMVGDGVNDAASLALADVGIAMGAIGSDAAIETAHIALMRDNLGEIPETIELGRYTERIAYQDFKIWAFTNTIGILLVVFRVIGPEGAAAFNFITDFFPLMNSLRLFTLHRKLKHVRTA